MTAGAGIATALHRTAKRSTKLLDRDAVSRIATFLAACQTPEGGFQNRNAEVDLYYTLFGLAALRALRRGVASRPLARYLDQQDVHELDLIHLVSLLQCRRLLHPLGIPRRLKRTAMPALERFRTPDGGYAEDPASERATAFGLYFGLMAEEVLGTRPVNARAMATTAYQLLGEYLDDRFPAGDLNGLAASAVVVQGLCGQADPAAVADEIRAYRAPEGAYRAHADAPLPDLLSTAVALFCLRFLGQPLTGKAAMQTASYVQELWSESGGFCGLMADDVADTEYTFYALLAMGALEP